MRVRRIKAYRWGRVEFEYFSDLIPRVGEFIEFEGNPWKVESVEYVVKYNNVVDVKVGVS